MRLGERKYIGIAISVAWLIGATAYQLYTGFRFSTVLRNGAFEICDYVNYRLAGYDNCWHDLTGLAASLDGRWANVAILSLGPIPLGWLVAYAALMLWRRARPRGRRRPLN